MKWRSEWTRYKTAWHQTVRQIESHNVEAHMCKKMSGMWVCHAQPHAVNKGATDDVKTDMFPDVPSHMHCIYNGSGTEWRENMMACPVCQYQMTWVVMLTRMVQLDMDGAWRSKWLMDVQGWRVHVQMSTGWLMHMCLCDMDVVVMSWHHSLSIL